MKRGYDDKLSELQKEMGCNTCEYADFKRLGYSDACVNSVPKINGAGLKCKNHKKKVMLWEGIPHEVIGCQGGYILIKI